LEKEIVEDQFSYEEEFGNSSWNYLKLITLTIYEDKMKFNSIHLLTVYFFFIWLNFYVILKYWKTKSEENNSLVFDSFFWLEKLEK
jgi:hypothetical protein